MSRLITQHLAQVRDALLTMGGYAESSLSQAFRSYRERDDELARRVEEQDNILDQLEVQLDETAIQVLALKGPVASDLRLITMSMKICHDLERVGDEATTIARRALELNHEPPLKNPPDLLPMAAMALEMLKQALDAFVSSDLARAKNIIAQDREMDRLNKQRHRELAAIMTETPATISRCLNLMVISKSLERIGDHAASIAEEVVYLYEGRDIRHVNKLSLSQLSKEPSSAKIP
jgi:phosphate transport system protein